jgi:alpha-ketoglutarate-dependent taurine dioxygenase
MHHRRAFLLTCMVTTPPVPQGERLVVQHVSAFGALTSPGDVVEVVGRVGDLVLWDNRCTMHRRDAFDPHSRRIMHSTRVKGEQRPV